MQWEISQSDGAKLFVHHDWMLGQLKASEMITGISSVSRWTATVWLGGGIVLVFVGLDSSNASLV